MINLIITILILCINILTLIFLFKTYKKIKEKEEYDFLNYKIIYKNFRELEKTKVKVVSKIIEKNRIGYTEREELKDICGITAVVFKNLRYEEGGFPSLQMCLEELIEAGYEYKITDGDLEIRFRNNTQ